MSYIPHKLSLEWHTKVYDAWETFRICYLIGNHLCCVGCVTETNVVTTKTKIFGQVLFIELQRFVCLTSILLPVWLLSLSTVPDKRVGRGPFASFWSTLLTWQWRAAYHDLDQIKCRLKWENCWLIDPCKDNDLLHHALSIHKHCPPFIWIEVICIQALLV